MASKEKLLVYDKDPKSKTTKFLLPFSQRDVDGTVLPSSSTQRIVSPALDSLGQQLGSVEITRERAKAARRYAQLVATSPAPVPA